MVDTSALKQANARRWASAKLTQERLKELLHYAPETGLFSWLVVRGRHARPGLPAGAIHKVKRSQTVYLRIKIDGKS